MSVMALYNALSGSLRALPRNIRWAHTTGGRVIACSVLIGAWLMLPVIVLVTAVQLGYYRTTALRRVYSDRRTVALVRGIGTPTWHASSWITRTPGAGDGLELGQHVLTDADHDDVEIRIQAANQHLADTIYKPYGFEYVDDDAQNARRPRMRRPRRTERRDGRDGGE